MLIFLWPIPEAFVLTEVNAVSDNWLPLLCGWAAVDSVASAFLLKLDPEARNGTEVPSGQLSLKWLNCKQ